MTISQSPDESPATPRPRRDPPPLPGPYRKAHKNYVLVSALLGSWQLIGIELETKEKWGIIVKTPNAVPVVLLILVFYFGYRLAIEWAQCNLERRANAAAKLDYRIAHAIAFTAVTIYVVQYLLRAQIIDIIARHVPVEIRLLVFATLSAGAVLGFIRAKTLAGDSLDIADKLALPFFPILSILTTIVTGHERGYVLSFVIAVLSFGISFLGVMIITRKLNR
jgi:hypothetical protein